MNRYITIAVVVLLVVAAAIGIVFLLYPNNPAPAGQQQVTQGTPQPTNSTVSVPVGRTKEAARAAFQQAVDKQNIDNTKLYETSIAGNYALQAWAGDVMGGQALLKYDDAQRRWSIVESSGGAWRVESLVSLGVSTTTAETLLAGMAQ